MKLLPTEIAVGFYQGLVALFSLCLALSTHANIADPNTPRHHSITNTVTDEARLLPSPMGTAGPGGQFGSSVAIDGNRVLIGGIEMARAGAAVILVFDGSEWIEEAKLRPDGELNEDWFGRSVSLSGNLALIGASKDNENGSDAGAAYVFEFDGANWNRMAKLVPSDAHGGMLFGQSVSLSGNRALVGAYFDNDNGSQSGSAYVFDFNGASWVETQKILPSDGAADARFGVSVSLSADRALVGAYLDSPNGSFSGSAYVFDFDGALWNESEKITPTFADPGDQFGISVSLDGNRALIGAHMNDLAGVEDIGNAVVFDFDGTDWNETERLWAYGVEGDRFGRSVSLSGDRALISAYREDENGADSGAAYLFEFDGKSWSETERFLPADGAAGDEFGWSVALSGDRVLVGAHLDDVTYGDSGQFFGSGSAYVFEFNGATWDETDKLLAPESAAQDYFGSSVSLHGNRAAIGSYGDDPFGFSSGSVSVFDFDGLNWTETVKLVPADASAGDKFGWSVSLHGDRLLVGSPEADGSAGAAYIFDFDGANWGETTKLVPSVVDVGARFGLSVSLEGNQALIGAPREDDTLNGLKSGAAYVFEAGDSGWSEIARLTQAEGEPEEEFGFSVSLSGDRALISAPYGEPPEEPIFEPYPPGEVYLFEFMMGIGWSQQTQFVSVYGHGSSVSLFDDRAIMFRPANESTSAAERVNVWDFDGTNWNFSGPLSVPSGATLKRPITLAQDRILVPASDSEPLVYLYNFGGTDWDAPVELRPANGIASGNEFGSSLAIFENRVLIGAQDEDVNGVNSGAAYVLTFNRVPIAQDDEFLVYEDTPLDASVFTDNGSGADADPDGDLFEVETPGSFVPSGLGGLYEIEANGDFSYTPPENQSGLATFEYTIVDSYFASSESVSVELNVLPVNDTPNFSAADPPTILEDAGPQQITSWALFDPGAPNEIQDVVAYEVTGVSSPGLFATGPTIDAAGTLKYSTVPDGFGTSSFDVTVQDDGGTDNGGVDTSPPQTFTIEIEPVNDAPTFTPGPDVLSPTGTPFSEQWATNISAGPTNESDQSVLFVVTENSNSALFIIQPFIDPAGVLNFAPAIGALGSAAITVEARDSGGTANGGQDSSAGEEFLIEVVNAADLVIDKTSGSTSVLPGGTITYTIVVENLGPNDVEGALVSDSPPPRLGNLNWSCAPTGDATCAPAGTGPISESVDVPAGDSVVFTLVATLQDMDETPVTNIASVSPPGGLLELDPANNSDSDTDIVGIFFGGFESGEPD